MSKATDFNRALMMLLDDQASRGYNRVDISLAQRLHLIEAEERERDNLLKRFGGTLVIAAGDEEKSPLFQRRKYVFEDGSELLFNDDLWKAT